MRFIKPLILFICTFTVSALAETSGSTPSQQPAPKDIRIVLSKQTGNKPLRAPSNNPANFIDGIYNEDGILFLYPSIVSEWDLVISSPTESVSIQTSTDELISGIYIGELSTFTIELSSSTGAIFVGTVYLE